ncbi:MAG: ECF transporter S component [Clostridia bacterium]|nr:ECF transporter S component [Clostridia bacterium]
MKRKGFNVFNIAFMAMMAAMVYVVTLFRFPLLGSKVHFANAVCLLGGLLLGSLQGGIAAGTGSALYDAVAGYDLPNVLITFVSKFVMAWVCGKVIAVRQKPGHRFDRTLVACISGALTYVLLYMLKTFIYQKFVYGFPMEAVWATLISKLIPSLINALAAIVATPLFFHAVLPALRSSGLAKRLDLQP